MDTEGNKDFQFSKKKFDEFDNMIRAVSLQISKSSGIDSDELYSLGWETCMRVIRDTGHTEKGYIVKSVYNAFYDLIRRNIRRSKVTSLFSFDELEEKLNFDPYEYYGDEAMFGQMSNNNNEWPGVVT